MSLPQIVPSLAGLDFTWIEERIAITVSRLRQHSSDGRLTGEIHITTSLPGYHPHLHQAQFNFLSTSTRTHLQHLLNQKCGEVNWDAILEQLCYYTSEHIRHGDPVVELWPSDDVKPPKYLIFPLIIKGLPNILFGDPACGKSNFALVLASLISLPWKNNPLGLSTPEEPTPVLYLDYETDQEAIRWQLGTILRGMELPYFPLHYRSCALPLVQDIELIQKYLGLTKAGIIIIDSLGLACGGELKEAEAALDFFSALRRLNITSLILAHTSKASEENKSSKSIYGSVFFEAQARNVYHMRKIQERGADEMSIALFHRKAPPFGKLQRELGFHFSFTSNKTVVEIEDPRSVGEFLQHMETQQRILELLKAGVMTVDVMATALETTENNIRVALTRLKKKNRILRTEKGFGLLTKQGFQ